MKRLLFLLLLCSTMAYGQTSDDAANAAPAFTAMKICNLPTTVVSQRGEWQMFLSHRFGSVNDGFKTFYGLDNANTCL